MKRLLFVSGLLICAFSLFAQENGASQINEIKRSTEYIYAEATNKSATDAYDDANAILEATIEDWARNNCERCFDQSTGIIALVENLVLKIETRRGDFYRVFVYVKKSDLLSFAGEKQIVVVQMGSDKSRQFEDICVEEIEEPQFEEEIYEPEEEIFESEEEIYEPEEEVAEPSVNLFKPDGASVTIVQEIYPKIDDPSIFSFTDIEKEFLTVNKFDDIKTFIMSKKDAGQIGSYGKHNTMPSIGDMLIIVYDQNGNIPAHLKRVDGVLYNMDKHTTDSFDNYHGCGDFWMIVY